jgi:hypothetical protein
MISGIYKLTFKNGDEYIGKSNNIEKRWEEHKSSFYRNKASEKMMNAFHTHGMPEFSVLMEAHKDHIDILEAYYISCERPSLNSVIAKCIHDDDFDLLMENRDLLKLSTVEHIETIVDSRDTMQECADLIAIQRDQIEELRKARTKEEVEASCYSKLQEEIDTLYAEAEVNDKTISNLTAKLDYLELPWWKRLFQKPPV